ncbi:LOW QUALITY PROTEIN: hypothetical protein M8C21_028370, partial [Ambrosia artemisiifolia]
VVLFPKDVPQLKQLGVGDSQWVRKWLIPVRKRKLYRQSFDILILLDSWVTVLVMTKTPLPAVFHVHEYIFNGNFRAHLSVREIFLRRGGKMDGAIARNFWVQPYQTSWITLESLAWEKWVSSRRRRL